MSQSSVELLLAQTATPQITPLLILGGIAALLGFVVIYLLCVPMRMMRDARAETLGENQTLTATMEQQRLQAEKDLDEAKLAGVSLLDEQRRAGESKIADRDRHIKRLEREAKDFSELHVIKSKLCDAQLANHVGRRVRNRLEEKIADQAKAARLALDRVEADRRAATAQTQRLSRKLRQGQLDKHVQRRLQQRLEDRIREQETRLQNHSQHIAEVTEQAQSLEGSLRRQSATAIQKKLCEVDGQSETLRRLQEQLQSSDMPLQACVEALAWLANGHATHDADGSSE